MAIIYSYPDNENLLLTDMLIGTSTIRINGRKKNITKNFTLEALGLFIQDNFPANTVPWGNITGTLSNQTDLQEALDEKQGNITLTTTGTSGLATLIGDTLNIPDYGSGYVTPTLQSVTDEGDTTTTTVYLNGGAISDSVNEQAVFAPASISTVNVNSGSGATLDSTGKLALSPDGLVSTLFAADNITQNITLQAPNKAPGSYTLATTDDIPAVTGFVPYTGATQDVNLGTHDLTATQGTFATSGNPDTLTVNHSSGSGKALTITKGGAGEGIYVNKTSGSGNAVTIVGDLEATNLKRTGGTSSQFLKADGSVDSNTYFQLPVLTSGSVLFSNGTTIAQDNTQLFWDDTNNRLGIGTTSPLFKLQVETTVNGAGGIWARNTNTGSLAYGTVAANSAVGGLSLRAHSAVHAPWPNTSMLVSDSGFSNGLILFQNGANPIAFWTNSNERMRIFSTGNTGIGTTTDAGYKLDVNGTARVSGELIVNGVNIGLGGGAITTNTRVGLNAGLNNTTGANNSFFGRNAGLNNTTGANNSFFGYSAGQSNTTGVYNSFFGLNAGRSNTTGGSNSFFGYNAGLNNTTGGGNSFFGFNAGRYIADGTTSNVLVSNSLFLGNDTKALADNQTNQIVIGYNAIGAGSNTATLGNTSIVDTILRGRINLQQYATGSRPTYVKGALIYDSTLDKLVVGGATGWEVVTSA
jgi:hypothetical protein